MVVGITGGIGSGKSVAIAILEGRGLPVLSVDAVSREIMLPGSEVLRELAEAFGDDILDGEDGSLKRKLLADKVFGSKKNTDLLNSIVHPAIEKELLKRIDELRAEDPERHIMIEIPLLYEAGWERLCDRVWCVSAGEKLRVERVMKRDGISRRAARARMRHQMEEARKAALADFVIYNDGSPEELAANIDKAISTL